MRARSARAARTLRRIAAKLESDGNTGAPLSHSARRQVAELMPESGVRLRQIVADLSRSSAGLFQPDVFSVSDFFGGARVPGVPKKMRERPFPKAVPASPPRPIPYRF